MSERKLVLTGLSSVIFFVVVPSLTIRAGALMDRILGVRRYAPGIAGYLTSALFLITGLYYVVESIRILVERGQGVPLGDLFPEEQSTRLLTDGIYGQTRNPMLFGYLECICGVGVLLGSPSTALIIPIGYTLIWTVWLKTREEPALEKRFGNEYNQYKEETPFLVPRPWKKKVG